MRAAGIFASAAVIAAPLVWLGTMLVNVGPGATAAFVLAYAVRVMP